MTPDDLIHRYLDGIATKREIADLDRLLVESPAAADAFARASRRDQGLESVFHEDQASAAIRDQIRRASSAWKWWGLLGAAAACLIVMWGLTFLQSGRESVIVLLRGAGVVTPLASGDLVQGKVAIGFAGESTRLETSEDAEIVVRLAQGAKRVELRKGALSASVSPQPAEMILTTPQAEARVLGTKFRLSTGAATRLEVTEGRVRLTRVGDRKSVDVAAGRFATTEMLIPIPIRTPYDDRFLALWRDLHDPLKGYFSPEGVPYHAAETLVVDAPDYGHLTTSETFSYWIWLEAMYGRLTGDWSWLARAWAKLEEVLIPSSAQQPTSRFYNAQRPATAVGEAARPEDYPVSPDPGAPVGEDTLAKELGEAYGSLDLYGMHWLADVEDWYGFGRRALINTYQRGPRESVWKTIPHPSQETFSWGGPNGYLDLFIREKSYARQWRYACAPDADARTIQALYWAAAWAREQGLDPAHLLPLRKIARMGDSLRYALREKYFSGVHLLLAWSYAWGGSLDEKDGWAWRTGGNQVHIGYQNPFAAWVLAKVPEFRAPSPNGAREWGESVDRQLEFYRWLQSEEGAFGGGARAHPDSGAQAPNSFHGMTYEEHPVFMDPPSNEWFGWQAWAAERLAAYSKATGDLRAAPILEKWARWARSVVELRPDGSYAIPEKLLWRGTPGALHVATSGTTQDVGVAAALARALARAGETTLAREIVDRMWSLYRDDRGLSNPEVVDPARFFEKVPIPEGWTGTLPGGLPIRSGMTFLDLRPKHRRDPEFSRIERAFQTRSTTEFRIHRFWAQVEAALACAELARASR